jgi:hypothetical protein
MAELHKVRVLENDGVSQLVQIEDEYGICWIRRSRVHKVGDEFVVTTERNAQLLRQSLARQKEREIKREAKEKLAREEKVVAA